ncbi:hypothetical protein FPK77_22600, partial [Acinetobacter baumannii]|nr:hypothetical protein [Acinetobacter baumannii]
SLGVVGGILAATLLINAWVNRQHDKQRKLPEESATAPSALAGGAVISYSRRSRNENTCSCHNYVTTQLKNKIHIKITVFYASRQSFFPYTR